jgi:hypothetical protein
MSIPQCGIDKQKIFEYFFQLLPTYNNSHTETYFRTTTTDLSN